MTTPTDSKLKTTKDNQQMRHNSKHHHQTGPVLTLSEGPVFPTYQSGLQHSVVEDLTLPNGLVVKLYENFGMVSKLPCAILAQVVITNGHVPSKVNREKLDDFLVVRAKGSTLIEVLTSDYKVSGLSGSTGEQQAIDDLLAVLSTKGVLTDKGVKTA